MKSLYHVHSLAMQGGERLMSQSELRVQQMATSSIRLWRVFFGAHLVIAPHIHSSFRTLTDWFCDLYDFYCIVIYFAI